MILEKIKQDIFERSRRKNIAYFDNENNNQEYDYRYCTSDMEGLDKYIFVVSKVLKYKGNSLNDFHYKVYVYDKEGNYVEDPYIKEKCRGRFFNTIKDIE
jgi:ribosomal protein S24E